MIPRSGPFCRGANMIYPPTPKLAAWTDARTALLRKFWAEGLSASHIANRLGGTTRNAVIGKVCRLQLASRKTGARVVPPPRKRKRRPAQIARRKPLTFIFSRTGARLPVDPSEATQRAPAEIRAEASRAAKRIAFADLEDCHCRFPLWETDGDPRHYCGATKLGSLPYCESHSRLCFQLPEPKRKPVKPVTVPAERELETA